jgi:putative FmdB family regulatory protein
MIYEYRCGKCESVNEFQMKMSDPHPTTCPSCNSEGNLERIISRTSFALKGSGWYTSDYKRAAAPAPASCEAKAAAGTACGGGACAVKPEA